MSQPATALLYDYLLCHGGAEQLTLELARGLDCDLWFDFIDHQQFSGAELFGLRYHTLGSPARHPVWRALRSSRAFEQLGPRINQYQRVVYSGSYAPLAIAGRAKGGNLYYCHTPPRFIYDLRDWYLNTLPAWQRPLLKALIGYLEPRYRRSIGEMQRVVANSHTVGERLRHHLAIESQVVYPPCRTDRYHWHKPQGYYLSTARLEPYKRIDLIIDAFRRMPDHRLLIASGGSDELRLRRLAAAADNIVFCGWVEHSALARLVGESIATIYLPKEEDFGISPVESMAAGKAVIGVAEGGLRETIVDGETGLLLDSPPTVEALCDAVTWLNPQRAAAMRRACEARARLFGHEQFIGRMSDIVSSL
jgi:glycosyltransferase involved in cell wall biosynthesis